MASCAVDIPFNLLIPDSEVSVAVAAAEVPVAEGVRPSSSKRPPDSLSAAELVSATTEVETGETDAPVAAEVAAGANGVAAEGATAAAELSTTACGAGTGIPCAERESRREPKVNRASDVIVWMWVWFVR